MNEQTPQSPPADEEHGTDPRLATSGAITYLHIPAGDPREAAAFYREVFGWQINNPDSDRPSFDTPNGRLSGAWVSKLRSVSEPGLLPYIYVDDVDDTVERIVAHGGEVVADPFREGLLTVATFRDTAGNVLGLWHDTTR